MCMYMYMHNGYKDRDEIEKKEMKWKKNRRKQSIYGQEKEQTRERMAGESHLGSTEHWTLEEHAEQTSEM